MKLQVTRKEIGALHRESRKNMVPRHAERFEHHYANDDAADEKYTNGTMYWCDAAADALLLLSIERDDGMSAMLLFDLEGGKENPSCYVVLSSRAWPQERAAAQKIVQ